MIKSETERRSTKLQKYLREDLSHFLREILNIKDSQYSNHRNVYVVIKAFCSDESLNVNYIEIKFYTHYIKM